MHALRNWKVKRSGARMTLKGEDCGNGKEVKLHVDEISTKLGQVWASRDGVDIVQLLT